MKKLVVLMMCFFFFILPAVLANVYIGDIGFTTSKTIYTFNETIELKGNLYLTNYSDNGSIIMNHTVMNNSKINITIINKNTNITSSTNYLNTSSVGEFYSKSDYRTTSPNTSAPSAAGYYYIRASYNDTNGTVWWTQAEIQVVNQTIDKIAVSTDKVDYDPGETMVILAEAIKEIGDRITHISNVSINGTIRNAADTTLTSFNCVTGADGKCRVSTTAPTSYGDYSIEANNYKSFSSFTVRQFETTIAMKDDLGKSIKHTFSQGEQASVEVTAITNVSSDIYTFTGFIKNNAGTVIETIDSTLLNSTNSHINRFTFTLTALNYSVGSYMVEVNTTKSGGGTIQTFTSFEVRSWAMSINKKEINSGFEYEYSAFGNKTLGLQIYPTWRLNGSVIVNINTTTEMNISLTDDLNNRLQTLNATFNSSCGKEGCYEFLLTSPEKTGKYYVSVLVAFKGDVQTIRKVIKVIDITVFAQSTDKDGTMKDLFGTNEYTYISLGVKNSSDDINVSDADIISVVYMNGSAFTYLEVDNFSAVNASNSDLEWSWNTSVQRFKLDTPTLGGLYAVYLSVDNNTAAAFTKIIVNPYDVCLVAKNTPGDAGGTTGYYYVYQFKIDDVVYYELKITQANNPTGRASSSNISGNSSYGMGSACSVNTQTQQVVNNATITVKEVKNMQTGETYSLNTTETNCQSNDNEGGYTCKITPIGNWDGGSYGVEFKVLSQNGETSDIAYGGFEARAFYLYAHTTNWRNKPESNITLTINMYEAGDNWWGNVGSGGLGGTVSVEKIEYQGRPGEWLWPPIDYTDFNVSRVNTSTISSGAGTMILVTDYITSGQWKAGYYRAILKGIDSDGNTDYGYSWFEIRRWDVYATPVKCISGNCQYAYNINSRENITLYVTITNAGEWGQSGQNLGGNVTVKIKKIQDCRKWPCTDYNSSKFNSTSIIVNSSSGWYSSGVASNYLINMTPNSGSWGTGYYQVVLDVNGSETGSGWFNTIAFYVRVKPTDSGGVNWKSSIKNNETKYFSVLTANSQKGGYYYNTYNLSDYLNTTIDSAFLQRWDQDSQQSVEYKYPDDLNINISQGGSIINGSVVINVTRVGTNWSSGYYWGEMTLKNNENETATGWLNFNVRPFRVALARGASYTIDSDACINGTMKIYNPDWRVNTLLNDSFNITIVTERIWTGMGNTLTTYTNHTPSGIFNGSSDFEVCPNNGSWGSGSWANYHYIYVKVTDKSNNSETGYLSFRALPFSVTWSGITGGTNVQTESDITVKINLTKATTGENATGNLTRVYQWRYDNFRSRVEEYDFSIGSCDTRDAGVTTCMLNSSQTVIIYAPSDGWKIGYNYLKSEWSEHDDSTSKVEDSSGLWFNGQTPYTGWFRRSNENGNYRYFFNLNENLTMKLFIRDSAGNTQRVNVTKVEYSNTPNCWNSYCRSFTTHNAYWMVGQNNSHELSESGIIRLNYTGTNWSRGLYFLRATISGQNGTAVIEGNVYLRVRDSSLPYVNVTYPVVNQTFNNSNFWINWTSQKDSNCNIYMYNYDRYYRYYCSGSGWNTTNSTNSSNPYRPQFVNSCNITKYDFNGSTYFYSGFGSSWKYWYKSSTDEYFYSSSNPGFTTGGTSHSYYFNSTQLTSQDYGATIYCTDSEYNQGRGYTAFNVSVE